MSLVIFLAFPVEWFNWMLVFLIGFLCGFGEGVCMHMPVRVRICSVGTL